MTDDDGILTITSGPRNARTDPETGLRWYTFQGVAYPSVTSLRRLAGIPHGLHQWMVGRVVERATLDHATLTEMLTRERRPRERVLESNRIAEAKAWLRAAATEERDRSSELGTAVHDAAAAGMTPEDVPDVVRFVKDGRPIEVAGEDIRPRLRWYIDWLAMSGAEIVAAEFQVVNTTVGYAGSVDALVRFPSGGIWVVDLKTGKGTYPDHALQLVAYRRAEQVYTDDVVDPRLTRMLRSARGMAILHLSDDGWSFDVIREDERLWQAFLGLHAFAAWAAEHPTMDRLVSGSRRSGEREVVNARIAAAFKRDAA